jgi:molybdenum cofactor guanylyltransferase
MTTVVLAGGQSRRMGQDKALLEVEGVSLIQRVCAAGKGDRTLVVTSWGDRYQVLLPDCEMVHDEKNEGPLLAFYQALGQVETPWVLLLACDLPFLERGMVEQWRSALKDLPSSAMAYLPRGIKGWEPLCGFYRLGCLSHLKGFLDQAEGRSFQAWLGTIWVAELPLCNTKVLFNCNTPTDLEQANSPSPKNPPVL